MSAMRLRGRVDARTVPLLVGATATGDVYVTKPILNRQCGHPTWKEDATNVGYACLLECMYFLAELEPSKW